MLGSNGRIISMLNGFNYGDQLLNYGSTVMRKRSINSDNSTIFCQAQTGCFFALSNPMANTEEL